MHFNRHISVSVIVSSNEIKVIDQELRVINGPLAFYNRSLNVHIEHSILNIYKLIRQIRLKCEKKEHFK